jgi:hypothetical protein
MSSFPTSPAVDDHGRDVAACVGVGVVADYISILVASFSLHVVISFPFPLFKVEAYTVSALRELHAREQEERLTP